MNVESILQRDRLIVAVALSLVVLLSWIYVLAGAGMGMSAFEMTRMSHSTPLEGGSISAPPSMAPMKKRQDANAMNGTWLGADDRNGWSYGYAVLMFFMWWIMMIGMMVPSASPTLLLYARMMRKERENGAPFVATGFFACGYIVMWAVFSAAAAGVQWGLQTSGLLSSMLVGTSSVLGAVLLIAAGAWQLSPLKLACLEHCQSPISFLSKNWRPGAYGALKMGAIHGAYCLGCCWFLMALLFYGGVMNLYWIVGLALYVLAEKMLPAGLRIERFTGPGLLAWGSYLLLN